MRIGQAGGQVVVSRGVGVVGWTEGGPGAGPGGRDGGMNHWGHVSHGAAPPMPQPHTAPTAPAPAAAVAVPPHNPQAGRHLPMCGKGVVAVLAGPRTHVWSSIWTPCVASAPTIGGILSRDAAMMLVIIVLAICG